MSTHCAIIEDMRNNEIIVIYQPLIDPLSKDLLRAFCYVFNTKVNKLVGRVSNVSIPLVFKIFLV